MMAAIKSGVSLLGLQPQTTLAMMFAMMVCHRHDADFTLTSVCDGQHSKGSLHYKGYAFDMRTRDMDDITVRNVFNELKQSLNTEFDVVLEETHLHIEWDPDN